MLDRITLSLLTEFSSEFSLEGEEDDRFEQFTGWLAVCRHLGTTSFNPTDLWTEGGGDTGIDAIGIIVNNNLITDIDEIDDLLSVNGYLDVQFIFVQTERSAGFDSAKIGTFGNGVRDFFGAGQLKRNSKISQFTAIMNAVYAKSSAFKLSNPILHLYYMTTGKWNEADSNLCTRRDNEVGLLKQSNQFSEVTFTPVGAAEIQHFYHLTKNAVKKQFLFQNKVLLPEVDGVTEAYLGFLPAKDYINLVRDDDLLIKGLFYENVRDFEGYNDINLGIKKTISGENPDRFVVMNNGITIIVRGELKTVRDIFTISDFYVVNGCQTTYVLHDNYDLITDKVHIPVRIIATKDENVFEDVIEATNSQTEIKSHQFFATRKFAKQLEAYFRAFPVDRRLYYERRANQYTSEEIKEKRRIITHEGLIRSVGAMFFNYAHITTKDFQSLKEKVGVEMFLETDRMEPYYVAALCLYKCEPLFGKKLDTKYKAARYQILYTVRLLIDNAPLPHMNSRQMEKRCNAMIETLWDDQRAEKLFLDAAELIEDIGGETWDRESIRTERLTRNISSRLGGEHGKRQE